LNIQQILLKYWGYSSFRPLQEDIIQSVLDGNDTLALLPTGGGKSITFQVPALARDGLCLVISPLIALMKDQVDNLKKRGIKAAAIYSGMHPDEIDLVFHGCRYGDFKLLYVSPERLTTVKFKDALKRMKVNLLAVDEAHCISQWGYDFRPPYLTIAEIREYLPGVPVLALTATAIPRVVEDIQIRLGFKKANLFSKSFERQNLTYYVIKEEDKNARLVKIIQTVKGSGIIYVRNRRHTKEISDFLNKKNIPATFYHAGLVAKERQKRQNEWMKEEKSVIVSTNAFGMGIDKPNVRFVIHVDLPDCIESYFQEAGRAGRDEKSSVAVLLYENSDVLNVRNNLETAFPEVSKIRAVYTALGNFLQIPVGGGQDCTFPFDISAFSEQYNFQQVMVYNSLKFLEKEGLLRLNDGFHLPSRLFIKTDKESLYRFQVQHPAFDPLIKAIIRSYSGVFSEFVIVDENEIGKRISLPAHKVTELITRLAKQQLLDYLPATEKPEITLIQDRIDTKELTISKEYHTNRFKDARERLEAMIRYAESGNQCRSQALLSYFGETAPKRCGKCDVCLERNRIGLNDFEYETIVDAIKPLVSSGPQSLTTLVAAAIPMEDDKVIRAVQWMVDSGKLEVNDEGLYHWIS
jgi:ATP-dependent DNA helicase RecQ